MFHKLGDERMPAIDILPFPAPAEPRNHVQSKPHVFQGGGRRQTIDFGDVTVQDDHSRNVQGNWGGEKCDIGESNKLAVDDDHVMGSDNS